MKLLLLLALTLFVTIAPARSQGLFTEAAPLTPAQETAKQLTATMDFEIRRRVSFRTQAWRAVWENKQATPQAILAALGPKATKVLTASTVDAEWFKALATATGKKISDFIDPKYLEVKAGWVITPNQDGTVTVTGP